MIQDFRLKWLLAIVVLSMLAAAAQAAINIETVAVGNLGNSADSTGYGAVGYAYNIGKYEVTAGQYTEFLNAVAATDTHGLYYYKMTSTSPAYQSGCKIQQSGSPGSYTYSVAGDWANRPVNYVSFWDAARFANWLHNGQQGEGTTEYGAYHDIGSLDNFGRNPDAQFFIPTVDEWYKAAYHKNDGDTGNYWDYPTSSDTVPSNDLIAPDPGNNATFLDYGGEYTIGEPYWRTEAGAHENSASPYGTFDQGGNLSEWTESKFDWSAFIHRGGSCAMNDNTLHTSHPGGSLGPDYDIFFSGFRVASSGSAPVPEPGTVLVWAGLGLVAFSFAGMRRYRRRKA